MRSIERQLTQRLLLGSLALSLLLGVTVWWLVGRQVRDLLDYQLEEVARTLLDGDLAGPGAVDVEDPALHLVVTVRDASGSVLYRSGADEALPADAPSGLSRIAGNPDGGVALRLFTLRGSTRMVQVAHAVDLRQDLARDAGFEIVAPTLGAMAALSVLIMVTVRRSIAPLRDLDEELGRRNERSLAPIRLPQAPQELQAVLQALNGLLGRVDEGFSAYRAFVADAAHELRTPLTVVRLQADNVAIARNADEANAAVAQLRRGVERMQRLVEQLLALARLESDTRGDRRTVLELGALARECLVDHAVQASARGMEFEFDAARPAWLRADAHAVRILIDNLLGNALKYAGPGGVIAVRVQAMPGDVRLTVRDHGPGIPESAREQVIERFYRHGCADTAGSGLGLAIVAEAVRSHGGRLVLSTPADGEGLQVEVVFPAHEAPSGVDPI